MKLSEAYDYESLGLSPKSVRMPDGSPREFDPKTTLFGLPSSIPAVVYYQHSETAPERNEQLEAACRKHGLLTMSRSGLSTVAAISSGSEDIPDSDVVMVEDADPLSDACLRTCRVARARSKHVLVGCCSSWEQARHLESLKYADAIVIGALGADVDSQLTAIGIAQPRLSTVKETSDFTDLTILPTVSSTPDFIKAMVAGAHGVLINVGRSDTDVEDADFLIETLVHAWERDATRAANIVDATSWVELSIGYTFVTVR